MTTGLFRHSSSVLHDMGAGHPECPERIAAIEGELEQRGYLAVLAACNAPVATGEQLARVHTAAHIDRVNRMAPAHGVVALDPDTVMNRHSLTAALHAAGAVVAATDAVIEGEMDNAFCLVRPPGHHATRETSMGFCIFNNVAVGIAHAMEQHGLQRVAVLDFDVHHGNGTEDIFRDDARVLMCSTYQYPWFPHQNNRSIPGHLVNCPLPSGTGSDGFRAAVNDHWLPALAAFRPEMIFISAGF
ncbi:MAG: histone deacetylase family protein, partial [Pseudomonadales bacterium]|nr:histone deacetylase family protein [Pseudomonadales bacterium]